MSLLSGTHADPESPVPQAIGQDETAELTHSTAEMVRGLNTIIHDISYLLTEMANQNFDIQSTHREAYVGEYQKIDFIALSAIPCLAQASCAKGQLTVHTTCPLDFTCQKTALTMKKTQALALLSEGRK